MKKLLHILLTVLMAAALAACTVDGDQDEQPGTTASAEDVRTLSFGFDESAVSGTRAVSTDTYPAEKRLVTLAIFVQTDAGFYSFLSEREGDFTEILIDPASTVTDRIYHATLEMPVRAEVTNIAVVGNYYSRYPECDLSDKLAAVRSWEELAQVQAGAYREGVAYADGWLNYKILTLAEIASVVGGQSMNIVLRRLSARIVPTFALEMCVGSEAPYYIPDDVVLTMGAQQLFEMQTLVRNNMKSASYLLPELVPAAQRTAIPLFDGTKAFNGAQRDLYFYETTGSEAEYMDMYLIYRYRPNTAAQWIYGTTQIVLERDNGAMPILEPNHAYEFGFNIPIPIPLEEVDEWNTHWTSRRP